MQNELKNQQKHTLSNRRGHIFSFMFFILIPFKTCSSANHTDLSFGHSAHLRHHLKWRRAYSWEHVSLRRGFHSDVSCGQGFMSAQKHPYYLLFERKYTASSIKVWKIIVAPDRILYTYSSPTFGNLFLYTTK